MTENDERGGSGKWIALLLLGILVFAVVLFIRCDAEVADAGFDYFRAKATELGNDEAKVMAWVRDEIPTLSHRGNVKGALGALWDEAGSPEEKAALAARLLPCCDVDDPAAASLDAVSPSRDKSGDETGAAPQVIKIVHRLLKKADDGKYEPVETVVYEGEVGPLVGGIHTAEIPASGTMRFVLRAGVDKTVDVKTIGAFGEEIAFTVPRPGREPAVTVRELWRRGNRVGPKLPLKGDRHDFVVLPCRISKFVRKKEEMLLKSAGRNESDEGKQYLALLDYCRESDNLLEQLEKAEAVRAQFDSPRVLMLSRINVPQKYGGAKYLFDLRYNRTSFEGDEDAALRAAQTRGFAEAGAEHAWLREWTKKPISSAFDIFNHLRDDYPNRPSARTKMIAEALAAFEAGRGDGGKVVFTAVRLNDGEDSDLAAVEISRADGGGLQISGGALKAEMTAVLKEHKIGLPEKEGKLGGPLAAKAHVAALTVENALLASDVMPLVPVDYVLRTEIDCGKEPVLMQGSTVKLLDATGGVHLRFVFKELGKSVSFDHRVWNSGLTIPGSLAMTEKALADARVYKGFFYDDARTYDDMTSLVVSRAILKDLREGKNSEYVRDKDRTDKKTIEYVSKGTQRVKVNGRDLEIPIINCKRDGKDIAVYDNDILPIVTVHIAEYFTTRVRCRLVDGRGIGIAGASVTVKAADRTEQVLTAPDGGFRLPPAADEKGYGKATMTVSRYGEEYGSIEVDLTAPGIDLVTVQCPRKRMHVAWLSPEDHVQLDTLKISDQVKRHIRGFIDRGESVAVPSRMVPYGGREAIAFYAYEPLGADVTAVGEDGLHNSESDLDESLDQLESDLVSVIMNGLDGAASGKVKDGLEQKLRDKLGDVLDEAGVDSDVADAIDSFMDDALSSSISDYGMISALHFYRGSLAAWYGYSGHRIGQEDKTDHELAVRNTLKDMNAIANGCDLLAGLDEAAGKLGAAGIGKAVGSVSSGVAGSAALAAFKAGYMTALYHINREFRP